MGGAMISREGIDDNACHYSEMETDDCDLIRVTWDHCYCVETTSANGGPITNADARLFLGDDVWRALAAEAYAAHVLYCRENARDHYEERE